MKFLHAAALTLGVAGLLAACGAQSEATPTPRSEGTEPPPVLYIADNQLAQLQADGTPRTVADLGNEGTVMAAVRAEDLVFVLREAGLQRVDLKDGRQDIVVRFHQPPLFGQLLWARPDEILLYSTALESACSPTGTGASIGLYEVATGEASLIFVTDERYVRPLGLAADHRSLYALPVGCDPEFDEFWQMPIEAGAAATRLPTWDAAAKEYGHEYAALSPDASSLAFTSSRYLETEETLRYRLSVYDLGTLSIARYDLPNPPSHIWGGLVWSNDSRHLYFAIDAGLPEDEPSTPYWLWALDIQKHSISRIAPLSEPAMHLLGISTDDEWLLLAPERLPTVTYIYLPSGEQVVLQLPAEGVDAIVH